MSSRPEATQPERAPAPADTTKNKKGLGKVLSRMKTVFRKGDSSKRASTQPLQTSDQPAPAEAATEAATEAAAPIAAEPPQSEQPPPRQLTTQKSYENATRVARMQIHEERARKLGTRYGLEIQPNEFHSAEGEVLRVEKSVRMRIHRSCHVCNTTFATGNTCPECQHKRCKQCARYPPRRTEAEKSANRTKIDALVKEQKESAPILPSYDYSQKIVLTRPSRTGGQDLVYKKVRQRVRRKCHMCDTLFGAHSKDGKTCDKCGHRRCDDCPRDPSERKKFPYGYPHDEAGQTFQGVHRCHECRKRFAPNSEDGADCQNCSHKKCPQCPRVKPRKVDPEPDLAQLEKVRLRFEGLTTSAS